MHFTLLTSLLSSRHTLIVMSLLSLLNASNAWPHGNTPASLQGIQVPITPGLVEGSDPIIIDKETAIQLGKALFWDINVGSDGMACASCHFHAGADARYKNQLSPGQLNAAHPTKFNLTASGAQGGPNYTLKRSDFPLHQLTKPTDQASSVVFTTDDIVSSAGVFLAEYQNTTDHADDACRANHDPLFHINNLSTRQVQTRQAPSVINAAFNFRNFWDGRANNIFNGVTVFGVRDRNASIWVVDAKGKTVKQTIRLENSALASQAVGPAVNTTEMSCQHRTFPELGRKLLTRTPLETQRIHPDDSVLATLRKKSGIGLSTTYAAMIKKAFAPRYWSGEGEFGQAFIAKAPAYSQLEANFSFYFGLALQLYQQTLISDQTPFDTPRLAGFPQMPTGLNNKQRRGLKVFLNAHCSECHKGPTLTSAAHPEVYTASDSFSAPRLINRKTINGSFNGGGVAQGLIDEGYFNTSVTPTNEDLGVGGKDPFGNPLSFSEQYLQQLRDNSAPVDPIAMNSCDLDNSFAQDYKKTELTDDSYLKGDCFDRSIYAKIPLPAVIEAELQKNNGGRFMVATQGAFKVPTLRNIELTGPYMHNGSLLTLEHVIDFYFRGGNINNPHHFATLVFQQAISKREKADLVAFLTSLTDERVRWERAPFDHPELRVPHGHKQAADPNVPEWAADNFMTVPAIGKQGRDERLGPLKAFHTYLQK